MIDLKKTENGLQLIPDDLEALAEARDITEALETQLCNGWTTVDPSDIGALTDGTIITDDWDLDDDGEMNCPGTVYWDSNYAVTDTLEQLRKGETVVWTARG
jgi:hypothetical protein